MEWMILPLKRYAEFTGRSRRKEYWMFALFHLVLILGLFLFIGFLGNTFEALDSIGWVFGLFYMVVVFGLIIPSLAVTVRRLHDTGRSGWMYFIQLIPMVGAFILLYFLCQNGDEGENEYGPDPKLIGGVDVEQVFS